jgi:hypothetical protein
LRLGRYPAGHHRRRNGHHAATRGTAIHCSQPGVRKACQELFSTEPAVFSRSLEAGVASSSRLVTRFHVSHTA